MNTTSAPRQEGSEGIATGIVIVIIVFSIVAFLICCCVIGTIIVCCCCAAAGVSQATKAPAPPGGAGDVHQGAAVEMGPQDPTARPNNYTNDYSHNDTHQ